MRWNAETSADKLTLVARALGVQGEGTSLELAQRAAEAVGELLKRIGHPQRLSEVGVEKKHFAACAELAMKDGATMTNPRAPRSASEIVAVYEQAL
jgi:alcohol dehydrogenase class IV